MPVSGYNTTTSYKGESYEELLKPLADYTKWFNEIEGAHNELQNNAELVAQYLRDEPDSASAKMYNEYSKGLESAVDQLYQGTNPSTLRNLLRLKKEYNTKIAPIGAAATERLKSIEAYDKDRQKDHDLFGDDPRNSSIDDFLYGRTPKFNTYSGKDIYSYAQQMGKGLSERIWGDPRLDKSLNPIWQLIQTQGIETAPEGIESMYFASKNGTGPKNAEIESVVDNILMTQGLDPNNLTDNNVSTAIKYAVNGLTTGLIYKESMHPMTNPYLSASLRTTKKGSGDDIPTPPKKTSTVIHGLDPAASKRIAEKARKLRKIIDNNMYNMDNPDDVEIYNTMKIALNGLGENYTEEEKAYILGASDGSNLDRNRKTEIDANLDQIRSAVVNMQLEYDDPDIHIRSSLTDKGIKDMNSYVKNRIAAIGIKTGAGFLQKNWIPGLKHENGDKVYVTEWDGMKDKPFIVGFEKKKKTGNGSDASSGIYIIDEGNADRGKRIYLNPDMLTEHEELQRELQRAITALTNAKTRYEYERAVTTLQAKFDDLYAEWTGRAPGESETSSDPISTIIDAYSNDND